MIDLKLGDCRERLKELPADSVDSIVTDPPYELGFMGKGWDSTGIAYDPAVWTQCLRVLKPGGHLLAFGGTRTYHRMVCAIEDAGFEIRDEVMWVYGSGFPKSLDISKAIDKAAGAEREVVGKTIRNGSAYQKESPHNQRADGRAIDGRNSALIAERIRIAAEEGIPITAPSTPAAKQWQGWGTALKPAHEPICLARKPIEGTVANNVLLWGVGGINVDGCRVGTEAVPINKLEKWSGFGQEKRPDYGQEINSKGRFPANVITDGSEEVVKMFPDSMTKRNENPSMCDEAANTWGGTFQRNRGARGYDGSGSACRFFYSAKASGEDRNEGLEGFEKRQQDESRKEGNPGGDNPRNRGVHARANNHPTVKPVDLMCYLCRLITPKGGTVLDPFMGSGSTGKAAQMEGFNFIGIELDPDYFKIATARIESADNLFTQEAA